MHRREGQASAIVVGSGPNGLVAAITLAEAGWRVAVLEADQAPGGGTRTEGLTLPGFKHDVCSSVHPLAVASPALRRLVGEVVWRHSEVPLAHLLDDGRAAVLHRSIDETSSQFGPEGRRWTSLMTPLVGAAPQIVQAALSQRALPSGAMRSLVQFAAAGLLPASSLHRLMGADAGALLGGSAAHAALTLSSVASSGLGIFLAVLGHHVGWPVAEGGSSAISAALVRRLESLGGVVECGQPVSSILRLPPTDAILLDLAPRQVLSVADSLLPPGYRRRLQRYRHGPGVFKLDWALDGPVPWTNRSAASATTIHLGGTLAEIARAEREVTLGRHPRRPFVIFVQATVADPGRAPTGQHTGWAYCHVPPGSTVDMTSTIESQVSRFAPGFRDRILARNVLTPADLERRNANLVGGDILGGQTGLRQLVARPTASLHPWRTPVRGLYLCSSSTPPGPGVHGMSGWHAARLALTDFRER